MLEHNLSQEQILGRVQQYWDLNGLFPFPKFKLQCPICGNNEILLKHMNFFPRNNSYRCDVACKCLHCSYVWSHGVVIPQRMFLEHQRRGQLSYTWRQIKEVLNGQRRET